MRPPTSLLLYRRASFINAAGVCTHQDDASYSPARLQSNSGSTPWLGHSNPVVIDSTNRIGCIRFFSICCAPDYYLRECISGGGIFARAETEQKRCDYVHCFRSAAASFRVSVSGLSEVHINIRRLEYVSTLSFLKSYMYRYRLVAWHSGRTSVSGRRTFPVLRSTCS